MKISVVFMMVLAILAMLMAGCAVPEAPGPAPEEITPEEVTPEEVAPEPAPTMEWGIIEIRVTDPPPADVKSAVVYLTNVEVHKAGAEQEREREQKQSGSGNQTQEKKGKQGKQQTQLGEQEQAGSSNQTQGKKGKQEKQQTQLSEQEQAGSDNQTQGKKGKQEKQQTQQGDGAWIPIIGAPPSFDLMDVIGVEKLLGSANVTAGKYTQIRMDVDRVEVETVDGDNFTAEVPSGKLKIVRPFNVEAGITTVLTLDFDGSKSLIITGKGKALFKPVVKLLVKQGEKKAEAKEKKVEAKEKKVEIEEKAKKKKKE